MPRAHNTIMPFSTYSILSSTGMLIHLIILLSSPSVHAQNDPAAPPDTLAARREEARLSREDYARQLPALDKTVRIQDIFTVGQDKSGKYTLTTSLGSEMSRGPVSIKVHNVPGILTAQVHGYTRLDAPFGLQFIHTDHSNPNLIQTVTFVNFNGNNLSIQRTAERLGGDDIVSFNASAGTVRVTLVRNDQNNHRQSSNASANSFEQLRDENLVLFHTQIRPILLDLGMHGFGGASPDDAFAVFADECPVDDKTLDAVRALLPQLAAEQFAAREKALASLRDLGRDGAIAARRIDRGQLSDQQATLLDAAISAQPFVPPAEAAVRRRDPHFLLDCLYLEDPIVRSLALTHLRKVLSKPNLAFTLDAPLEKRRTEIENIRRTLPASTKEKP